MKTLTAKSGKSLVVGQVERFSHNKGQRLYWDRGRLARRERVARAKAAADNIRMNKIRAC
jgi:hypothetical protein